LLEVAKCLGCRQATAFAEIVKEFAALDVFEYKIQLCRGFPDIIKTHDIWVIDKLHNDNLALDAEKDSVGVLVEPLYRSSRIYKRRLGHYLYRCILPRL
jgi:hypothetical protein